MENYKLLNDVEAIVLTKEYYAKELGQLQFENIILKDRIDKAIEYIENNKWELRENGYSDDWKIECKPILDILKGENNE